jgi:diketogulonate reductase-like aldo/keto reductase
MRNLELPSGNVMPVLGLGTWRMGEHGDLKKREIEAVEAALEAGIRLIDTAEMYGEGGAEEVIGEAIRGRRDDLFLVSKFYPHNAGRHGVIEACERSLRRMDCEYIDLYLLHWPGGVPLSQTFEGLHELKDKGRIRDFGVSNFNLRNLQAIPETDQPQLGCNQVFYNLAHREVEWEIAAWCRERGVPLMAYSPLDQGGSLLQAPALREIAAAHGATAAQVALAWLLQRPDTAVIPKSSRPDRIRENLGALEVELSQSDLAALEQVFPPPDSPVSLGMR